jgi:hypothetical protein
LYKLCSIRCLHWQIIGALCPLEMHIMSLKCVNCSRFSAVTVSSSKAIKFKLHPKARIKFIYKLRSVYEVSKKARQTQFSFDVQTR